MAEINTVPEVHTISTETVTWDNYWVVAYPIQIRWKQGDLASITSASSPTGSAASNETVESGCLSTAAKAGIGVGVALGGIASIAIFIAAYMHSRRRKIKQRQSQEYVQQQQQQSETKPVTSELAGHPSSWRDVGYISSTAFPSHIPTHLK